MDETKGFQKLTMTKQGHYCRSSTWRRTTAIPITSCRELRVAYLTKKPRRF